MIEYYECEWRQGLFVESLDGYLERHKKLGKKGKKVVAAIKKLEKSGNVFVPFSVRRMNKELLGNHHVNPATKLEVREKFDKFQVITLDLFRLVLQINGILIKIKISHHSVKFKARPLQLLWKSPVEDSFKEALVMSLDYWSDIVNRDKKKLGARSDQSFLMVSEYFVINST